MYLIYLSNYVCIYVCVMHVGLSLSMTALPKPCLTQLGDHMVLARILSPLMPLRGQNLEPQPAWEL